MLSQREQDKDLQRGGVKRPRHLNTGSAFPAQTLQTVFDPTLTDLPAPSSAFNTGLVEPYVTEELPRRVPQPHAMPTAYPRPGAISYTMPSNGISAAAPYDVPPAMERWALPLPPRAKKSSHTGSQAGSHAGSHTSSSRSAGSSAKSHGDDYPLAFGAPSASLGDFSFDFAMPTTSFDAAGAIQYQLSEFSQHNPMPPAYMQSHLLTPVSTAGPYSPDVKSHGAPPYAADSTRVSTYY